MAVPSKEARRSIRRRRRRRVAMKLNNLVAFLLGAALLLMVNYLAYRHYARADLSRSTFYDLSDQSRSLLAGLSNRVDVAVVFAPDDALFEDVRFLIEVYERASDQIQVEMVDPNLDLARARELKARYNLAEDSVVVFACADRIEVVFRRDLVSATYDSLEVPLEPSAVFFRGELMFSSAIKTVALAARPLVYVLQGHGEGDIESYDEYTGYSDIAQAMRHDNMSVRPLVLGERKTVPPDAAAIVIPRPAKKISQPELDILRDYLDRSGRMLVLLEPKWDGGLRPLLADWGVHIYDDLVVDQTRTLNGPELVVSEYGAHAITRSLSGVSTIFYFPRTVQPAAESASGPDPADKPRVVALASSSAAGWAETDFSQKPLRFDPEFDRPGPVDVAVAVEKGPVPGIDLEIRPTRMVVVGDADFVSNRGLSGGNKDLFLNMLNWLAEREALMGIAPKPFETYRLVVSRRQIRSLLAVVAGALPAAVAILGLLVWARRRA